TASSRGAAEHTHEAAEKLQSHVLALLRMEDARVDVVPPDARDEFDAVLGRRRDDVAIDRLGVEGVHEVYVVPVGHVRQRGHAALHAKLVPPHVRHLELRPVWKAHDLAAEDPEPAHAGRLLALLEEQLHADADTEERTTRARRRDDRLDESR